MLPRTPQKVIRIAGILGNTAIARGASRALAARGAFRYDEAQVAGGAEASVVCVCVLGCRVGSPALARRIHVAAERHALARTREPGALLVACGGRAWGGRVESDAMAEALIRHGVPAAAVVRERCSLDTRDNARFAAALLARRGIGAVLVVTCDWHLPRALRLFRATGLDVVGVGVPPPPASLLRRSYWHAREALSSWHDARRDAEIA